MAKLYPFAFFDKTIVPIEEANLSVASSAVLYGLSVYTVFQISSTKNGLIGFRLKEHFERLQNSAKIIGMDIEHGHWNYDTFLAAITLVVSKNKPTENVFVRASFHVDEQVPGTRSRNLRTALSIFVYAAFPIIPQEGARLKTSVWRRIPDYSIPSRAKVNGAYINSVLAKQDALDSGYDDCVFLDTLGHVCELSAANIFIVRDSVLITPDTTSDLLEGINRRTIIELAREKGIEVIERAIDLTELYIADEAFACGTSAFVAPIKEIDARQVGNGKAGPITTQVRELHAACLKGENNKHDDWITRF